MLLLLEISYISMNTQQIAEQLVTWFNAGEMIKPYTELYSQDIISIEPQGPNKRSEGIAAVMKKGEWWEENFEVHGQKAEGPLVGDDWFSVKFWMDTTHKPSSVRSEMSEIAVYKVVDGKIIYEEFFYNTQ